MKEFLPARNSNIEALAMENEELKSMLSREQDYHAILDKVI
jgi:hypothetical protein